MYVLHHRIRGGYLDSHLYEMTAKEFREAQAGDDEDHSGDCQFHERIDAARAHRHVKEGRIHSTALYTDDEGRIRRARDGF